MPKYEVRLSLNHDGAPKGKKAKPTPAKLLAESVRKALKLDEYASLTPVVSFSMDFRGKAEGLKAVVEGALRKAKVDATVDEVTELPRPATSRSDRLQEAATMVDDAKQVVEDLKSELESWKDGMPENLQNGSKAQEIDDAVSELESLGSELDGISFDSVNFPGMF